MVDVGLLKRFIERAQVVEYLRSFLASRPDFSMINGLLIISGAFGLFRRQVLADIGGFRRQHLGEDMEITLRMHRALRRAGTPYRIAYAAESVAWTEVPRTFDQLARQRVRWHRGLIQVIREYRSMIGNQRYGVVGLFSWPAFLLFEYAAPVIAFVGWFAVPPSVAFGFVPLDVVVILLGVALFQGAANSVLALFVDDRFGFYREPRQAAKILATAWLENFGYRQRTVWWRVRVLFRRQGEWGEMNRSGIGNLSSAGAGTVGRGRRRAR